MPKQNANIPVIDVMTANSRPGSFFIRDYFLIELLQRQTEKADRKRLKRNLCAPHHPKRKHDQRAGDHVTGAYLSTG